MRVFVTGGAGFIGSHLTEYHLGKGDEVWIVDDLSTGSFENVAPFLENSRYKFSEDDILTWPELPEAVAWADRIYHMAAVVGVYRCLEEPVNVLMTNIMGGERLLREAGRSGSHEQQIILASSSEVYGHTPHLGTSEGNGTSSISSGLKYETGEFRENMILCIDVFNASLRTNYPISKLALESLGFSYAKELGRHITVVRLFNTTGPRQTGRYGMVVPRFVRQVVAGEPVTVYGDGTQCRCFCDVRDTVVALDALAGNPASAGEVVNVGHNREISIRELAELVKECASSNSQIVHIPHAEAYGKRFEETYHRRPSLEKLFKLTNFRHRWTLEKTLDVLIEIERRSPRVSEADTRWQRSHIS